MARLQDKVIIIVGGTSGLGLAAARACHAEGACLVVLGRDEQKCSRLPHELGERVCVISADACEESSAEQAVAAAVSRYGRLDGLYHVAGGSGRRWGDGPLDQIPREGWQQTLDWNLNSVFYSNRAAVRQFRQQQSGGSVLNMASVLASRPVAAHFVTHAYAAAKSAILGLTTAAAAYYAPWQIRFNAVAPGLVDTPMAQRAANDAQIMDFVRHKQPLDGGRIGHPQDLDAAVVFFLSDESRFVTGQTLAVDGGWCVSDAGAANH
jgi:NAD(P)-dependent dehydrogenase (short-subunit alcohol dehydrogenase family)